MNRNTGFTVIELMVTISIAAILVAVAVPAFSNIIKDNRLTGHLNDFVAAASLARSEAMKTGNRVSMCPKKAADDTCGTNWEGGWIIFVDENADAQKDGGEKVVRVHAPLAGSGITLRGSSDTDKYLSFNSQGLAVNTSATPLTGEMILCDDRKDASAKGIFISGGGSVTHRDVSLVSIKCP
ncbi:MAG: GspH/FimT family pseudopilin [Pseudomonadota bacterium]